MQMCKVATSEYADLLLAEEQFFKDKSRVQWLKAGDRKTAFFP